MDLSHYRVGKGEQLVLLHGIGMQWQAFEPLFEELSREREVIAIDMPGFGASPTLPIGVEPGAGALAQGVAGFLDSIDVERPAVCGLSLGGWVALELARLGRAKSLVLISPGGFASPLESVIARGQLKLARMAGTRGLSTVRRTLKTRMGPKLLLSGMMGQPNRVPYDAAVAINTACGGALGWDGALRVTSRTSFTGGSDVDVPVTLLWGTKDFLLRPKRMVPRVLEQIPHTRHVPIEGAGHLPMWDAPDVLVREMLAA